jgi:hypothetical protein
VVTVSVIDERKMGLAMGTAGYLIKPVNQEKPRKNLGKTPAVLRDVIPRPNMTA